MKTLCHLFVLFSGEPRKKNGGLAHAQFLLVPPGDHVINQLTADRMRYASRHVVDHVIKQLTL